ncbi:MAG: hypothetical protein ABSA17_09240 [Rhabdochlamydiaceae bacterium]
MDWTQVITIVGANIILIMGMLGTIIALHLNSDKKITAIADEMKDFHGRLCKLEERRIQILEK